MSAARKSGRPEMASAIVHTTAGLVRLWECKQCHNLITDDDNVAYHLIDRCLYGWCRSCFDNSISKIDSNFKITSAAIELPQAASSHT
jgi:hypothetical protein